MADALSLAVNIFTLLEFGRKFATLAWTIHKDGKDAVSKITSLDLTSKDLIKIAGDLSQPMPSPGGRSQDQTTERIHQVATRCINVAGQMQETIRELGMDIGSHRKGSSMLKAFKVKWKDSDVVAFQSEIEDLRSELMLNLILWLRTGMMETLEHQVKTIQEFSELRSRDEGLKIRLDRLDRRQEGFVQHIVQILSFTATSARSSLEKDLMNAMQSSPQQIGGESAARLQISPIRIAHVRAQFINMFRYDSMFDREDGVAEAYPDTLKWIFESPSGETNTWGNFSQWLESEEQLYWITGKMGSGKSTLMKYISEQLPATSSAGTERRCMPYLIRWAQDRPLFVATFYFWAGSSDGTGLQTSVEGLYRTLLTQILEMYPESAPHVSPRLWENICLFNKDFKPLRITELKAMSRKAIEYVSSVAKVCLFIDGLDEFEGKNDDLKDLITWVKTLVEISPVKLCVASRPWPVFEDALRDRPHLLMENFNFQDIQRYVWRRFNDDPNFRAKKQMEAPFCNQLLFEIINKAEGVFLWVHIVCTHLLEAMSRGDLVGDLRRILNALPVQMEKLYDHILNNLEVDLKDHAAKYFLLLQACLGRPGALIFSFADDIGEDNEFSLKMPEESLTEAHLQYRLTELRKRLNSRCRGLLSLAVEDFDSRETTNHLDKAVIQYCHRSAKDYFTMDSIQKELIVMLDGSFDPHLRLCSAYLARWKCGIGDASETALTRQMNLCKCVQHAAKVDSESPDMIIRILDDMNPDFEPIACFAYDNVHFGQDPWFGGNLLSYAVVLGLSEYVKCKLGRLQGCMVTTSSFDLNLDELECPYGDWGEAFVDDKSPANDERIANVGRTRHFLTASRGEEVEWPLLLDAILATSQPNTEMVSLLLEHGANPNLTIRGADWEKSVFHMVSSRLFARVTSRHSLSESEKEAWVDSMCILLQRGSMLDKSEVKFVRELIGKYLTHGQRPPHLGRHRDFFRRILSCFDPRTKKRVSMDTCIDLKAQRRH